jgi:hypothetical protein
MSRCHLAQRERHRPQRQNDRGAWRAIARAAVRRGNADQHPVARHQRRHDRAIGLNVRRRAGFVSPKTYFVKNNAQQRLAANRSVNIHMYADHHVVRQSALFARALLDAFLAESSFFMPDF